MKYAYIENNKAIEVISANPHTIFVSHYAEKFVEVDDSCEGGYIYVNGQWEAPPPVIIIPQEVTMRQARLALLDNNLLHLVQPAIDSLPEPNKTKAQIEWDYSNALQRDNQFVAILGGALGLSSQDLDNLFILASTL